MACSPTGGLDQPNAPPPLTVAEGLRAALPDYTATHRLPAHHWKILHALFACRTARLGGHVYRCLDCGQEHFVPHSCRNRHCPACQRSLAEGPLRRLRLRAEKKPGLPTRAALRNLAGCAPRLSPPSGRRPHLRSPARDESAALYFAL